MTLQQSSPTPTTSQPAPPIGSQLAAAQRELQAFVSAVAKLYGVVVAQSASQRWVEAAERAAYASHDGSIRWRRITIAAASWLATEHSAPSAPDASPTNELPYTTNAATPFLGATRPKPQPAGHSLS